MNCLRALRVGSWPGAKFDHNPYLSMFCGSLRDAGVHIIDVADPRHLAASSIDVLHVHWPEKVFWDGGSWPRVTARLTSTLMALRRLKQSGVKLVWTVHNLRPHDLEFRYKPLWALYAPELCRLVDGFVTLSPSTVEVVRQNLPGLRQKPAIYAWHPAYRQHTESGDRENTRRALKIDPDTKLFGFLGYVRPYKGIEELISAFRNLRDEKVALMICGTAFRNEDAQQIRELAQGDRRIYLDLRRVSDQEFSALTVACDVIVLPFRSGLHSGSLVSAVSHGRAALTPDSPFAASLREAVGEEFVHTYTAPLTPEILDCAEGARKAPALEALSTDISGQKLADFYRSLTQHPGEDRYSSITPPLGNEDALVGLRERDK